MSHTIVYVRQFLKLPDGKLLPLCLMGSSNVTEPWNYNRRAREWWYLNPAYNNPDIALSPEDLLKVLEGWTGGKYQEHFKYRSRWIDDARLLNFAKRGISEAMTLEELREHHPDLWLTCQVVVSEKERPLCHSSENYSCVETSEGLLAFLDKARERILGRNADEEIHISITYPKESSLYSEIRRRTRPGKRRLEDNYYVIYSPSCAAFVYRITRAKRNASALTYHYSKDGARRFPSLKAARAWLDKFSPRFKSLEAASIRHVCTNTEESAA